MSARPASRRHRLRGQPHQSTAWPALKEQMPYGALPVLELPGHPPFAQTNRDPRADRPPPRPAPGRRFRSRAPRGDDAARRGAAAQRVADAAHGRCREKGRARGAGRRIPARTGAEAAERNLASAAPFFGGATIHVVDIKLHMAVRWFLGGKVDHIPATIFAAFPKLMGVHDAVRDHPGVKAWYENP